MIRTRSFVFVAIALFGLAACGKKDGDKAAAEDKTPPVEPAPAPVAPTPPTPPPPPPAVYSADTAKQLIAKMSECIIPESCDPYPVLIGFGPQVGPDLLAAIADPAVPVASKRMAAQVITALKLPDVGPKLVELGSAIDDNITQSDIFKAAGVSGGQATFDALILAYAKASHDSDDDREIPLRGGLKAFPTESVAWAVAELGKKGVKDPTAPADLISDSATANDLPQIVAVLAKVKEQMTRHRLAAKAIELGDTAHFDVFIAGLKSDDQYDRSDAAGFLAEIADKVPADQKATFVELLEKGKAGDQGGLTAMGYDEALKKLK